MVSLKVKLHLLGTFLFTLFAYVIPLSFTGYLFSSEAKQSVHTLVTPDQFGDFISGRIFIWHKWQGKDFAFLGFRFTYILCLWACQMLFGMVQEVIAEAKRPKSGATKKKKD